MKEILFLEKRNTDEVSVCFVTEKKISTLHHKFFNDPTPTDCISFPIDEGNKESYHILGEIFISPQAAINFFKGKGSANNIYIETTLYLIHGLLHLMGYDDIEKSERRKMRYREKKYLDHLIASNILIHPQ